MVCLILGTKWLTEAIHENEITTGALNIVEAPTGSGKTTWAFSYLDRTVSAQNKMLYLIDTINGKAQLLQRDDTIRFNKDWCADVLNDTKLFGEKNIVVMTYAKFGSIVNERPAFGFSFEVILCDEIHSLPRFSAFLSDRPDDKPLHKIAKEQLEHIIAGGKVKVIGLSATPERAERDFHCGKRKISVDKEIRRLETRHTVRYSGLDTVLEKLSPKETGIIYVGHIQKMKEIWEKVSAMGFRAIAIWSSGNTDKPMTQEQTAARDYILSHEEIPPAYNLLIINASSETSINIRGNIGYMVIHSQENEPRVQVRGRYRGDLELLYLLDYAAAPVVPDRFMGRKLFREEKDTLSEILGVRGKSGRALKWTGTKERLIEAGYSITESRERSRRYAIITH